MAHRLGELLRRIGARQRVAAAEQEGRNTGDAGIGRPLRLLRDQLDIDIAGEPRANLIGRQAAIGRRGNEHLGIGEVGAVLEVKIHQALLHRAGLAALLRPVDQPMAIDGVGLAIDAG